MSAVAVALFVDTGLERSDADRPPLSAVWHRRVRRAPHAHRSSSAAPIVHPKRARMLANMTSASVRACRVVASASPSLSIDATGPAMQFDCASTLLERGACELGQRTRVA